MRTVRIFLSSPGDCNNERTAVHELVSSLNSDPLVSVHSCLRVVAWDWEPGVPLDALKSPQASVNEYLSTPEACDLFIGIFRCRFGTPLPIKEFRKGDGTPFLSGSEYEFHRAWEGRRRGAAYPQIFLYRWQGGGSESCADREQWERLEGFFRGQPFRDGDVRTGSVHHFRNTRNFARQLEGHLRRFLSRLSPGSKVPFVEWLRRQAEILSRNAWPRYIPAAHVETEISRVFDWLLARPTAISDLDEALGEVWKAMRHWPEFEEIRIRLREIGDALREDPLWERTPDFSAILEVLDWAEKRASAELERLELIPREGNNDQRERWDWAFRQVGRKAREAQALVQRYSSLASRRVLILTGPAGQGKTHTVVHEVQRTIREEGIALGVLGQTLSTASNLWSAVLGCLDFHESSTELLDKLETEAAQRNQRALLVLDALNETPERSRWRHQLPGMLTEILRRPHLTVAMAVRSDYLKHVLPPGWDGADSPWVVWQHPGFSGVEPTALMRYFAHFEVKAPVAPPLGELANPLYVQLLAKSLQGRGEITHWLPSWLEVWTAWIERLEQDAAGRINLDPSRPCPIRRTLERLAQAMLDGGVFAISRPEAEEIARLTTGMDEIIGFLCSAGALIDRIDSDDQEIIEFAYERLTDTFLVDRLLQVLFRGLESAEERRSALASALAAGGMLHPLASTRWIDHPMHFRRPGLLQALCLAAPRIVGVEFPSLLAGDADQNDWDLASAFIDSLRWRSQREEFGAGPQELWQLWQKWGRWPTAGSELDELIRLSLIPHHPFAMEHLLHPWLLRQESPGARDAEWSIELVPWWSDESSNLRLVVQWAQAAPITGVHPEVALPVARLLAWACATSQRGLRDAAIQGLTRVLAACPGVAAEFLPDFLAVNDAYVLESVLVAVLGLVTHGQNVEAAALASQQVLEAMFPDGNARWCHLTIRHYARRIVEEATSRTWLTNVDLSNVRPPYRISLPLGEVPDKAGLEALDTSKGFRRIVFSSTEWDFFRYVMGGNSAILDFSSRPRSDSSEPQRPYLVSENVISQRSNPDIFNLALAARFVAWNTLALGWTAERFDAFDTGYYTEEWGRHAQEKRTERVGKKYQWISWFTMLGFLTDNYGMRPDWNGQPRSYDNPGQLPGVDLFDPLRWLKDLPSQTQLDPTTDFWAIPSLPRWPTPEPKAIHAWVASASYDLPPSDVIEWCPRPPPQWGSGRWLRVSAEHSWLYRFAPGQWAVDREYYADIRWQLTPRLIFESDLSRLLELLDQPDVRQRFLTIGRIDPPQDNLTEILAWPSLTGDFGEGFGDTSESQWDDWFPVPWMPLVGESRYPDYRHAVLMPWPRLFRDWDLRLDLRRGVVEHGEEVLFGLAGWTLGQQALLARQDTLQRLLDQSGYRLTWFLRGERRAFLNWGSLLRDGPYAWMKYHGLAFLGVDGRVHTAWLARTSKSE